jgi:hypothetical protein
LCVGGVGWGGVGGGAREKALLKLFGPRGASDDKWRMGDGGWTEEAPGRGTCMHACMRVRLHAIGAKDGSERAGM